MNFYILFIHENLFSPITSNMDLEKLIYENDIKIYENNKKIYENISLILSEQKLVMKNIETLSNRLDRLELSQNQRVINKPEPKEIRELDVIYNDKAIESIQSKASFSDTLSYEDSQKDAYELLKDLNIPD